MISNTWHWVISNTNVDFRNTRSAEHYYLVLQKNTFENFIIFEILDHIKYVAVDIHLTIIADGLLYVCKSQDIQLCGMVI